MYRYCDLTVLYFSLVSTCLHLVCSHFAEVTYHYIQIRPKTSKSNTVGFSYQNIPDCSKLNKKLEFTKRLHHLSNFKICVHCWFSIFRSCSAKHWASHKPFYWAKLTVLVSRNQQRRDSWTIKVSMEWSF